MASATAKELPHSFAQQALPRAVTGVAYTGRAAGFSPAVRFNYLVHYPEIALGGKGSPPAASGELGGRAAGQWPGLG